jgi:hypothetical protein
MTEKEEQALLSLCSIVSQEDGMAIYTSDDSIILKDVDIAPVYNGCEELSIEDTRDCFNTKISTFIKREFNLSVSKDLNLPEPKQVEAFYNQRKRTFNWYESERLRSNRSGRNLKSA